MMVEAGGSSFRVSAATVGVSHQGLPLYAITRGRSAAEAAHHIAVGTLSGGSVVPSPGCSHFRARSKP